MTVIVTHMLPEHIPALVEHQRVCYPTMGLEDLFSAAHFAAHLQLFPVGQHVALLDGQLVGESSTFRIRGEYVFAQHTFHEIVGDGYFTKHDEQGEWLYGADMSVHPDCRGMRVASALYNARKELIGRLGLRGMVAGGMLPGFPQHRDSMDIERYIAAVVAGQLIDPTLTPQLKNGFTVRGVLREHIRAGEMGSDASLLVWEAS